MFEDRGGLAHATIDRGRDEGLGQPFRRSGAGIDGRLQLRPARETELAGDHELRGRQRYDAAGCNLMVASEALEGVGVAAADGVTQLLGLPTKLAQVRTLRK
jgi:hypothetical protein